MTYKYFGLIGLLVLLCGLVFVVKKWPQSKRMTFSQHVAQHKIAVLYYIVLFSIDLPLLLLFFIGWFIPTLKLTWWFGLFIVMSSVAQYACTLIPEVGGWKSKFHRLSAGVSAFCLVPALSLLLMSDKITTPSKFITAACLLVMIGAAYLVVKYRGKPDNFLVLQASYFAAFFTPVLFISYLQF